MNRNSALRFGLLIAAVGVLSAALVGCSQRNPDINRVEIQPYWSKADFDPRDSWYTTTTVIEAGPNSGRWGGPGETEFLVTERLRWEITETQLIGWRDYAAAIGSEQDSHAGGDEQFKGAPVAVFPIVSHFDIRRTYDALTGEEGNEIVENETDRVWYEREFFRVDWSRNEAASLWNLRSLTTVGDSTPEFRIVGGVDLAHTALAELADDFVVIQFLPNHATRLTSRRIEVCQWS